MFCSPTWQSSQKLLQNWQCSADSAHLFLYPTNKIKYQIRKCWSRLEIDFCRYQTLNLHLTNSVIEWHRCFLGKLSFITCNKNNPNWNDVQTQIKTVCWLISPMNDSWYTLIYHIRSPFLRQISVISVPHSQPHQRLGAFLLGRLFGGTPQHAVLVLRGSAWRSVFRGF